MAPLNATFKSAETIESQRRKNDPNWEPEWYHSRGDVALECDVCGDKGHMLMEGKLTYTDDPANQWEEAFRPIFCDPNPRIITLSDRYPQPVQQALCAAFALAWGDPAASGTHLRIALERLLDALNIENIKKNKAGCPELGKNGLPIRVGLHERLKIFKKRGSAEATLGSFIESVKWLGNTAAHDPSQITEDSVFHAFYVVDAVLQHVFLGQEVSSEAEYYSKIINLFYEPSENREWPVLERPPDTKS